MSGLVGKVLAACEVNGRDSDMELRFCKPLPSELCANGATLARSFRFALRGPLLEPPEVVRWWLLDECGCWD